MDNNGIPAVVTGKAAFADADVQSLVTQVTTPARSVGEVVTSLLEGSANELIAVITPDARKVFAFSEDEIDTATVTDELDVDKQVVLRPVTGQTGRSLVWEQASADVGFNATTKAMLDALYAPVTPKRSVESLVAAILAAIDEETAEADVPTFLIDQGTGLVIVGKPSDRATLMSDASSAVGGATNGVELTLAEPPPEDEGPDPLIFEGGSTGA